MKLKIHITLLVSIFGFVQRTTFPSSPQPTFQSEAKCEVFVFIYIEIGINYHDKNFALRLALEVRLRETRKWPIEML